MSNNIIFAGDSFTWGQGIQYYSDFQDIKRMPNNQYIKNYLTDEHVSFIKNNRFARIVSNHFNMNEIVKSENGGSDEESIDFIYKNLNNETKAVVLQTTQPIRCPFVFTYNDQIYKVYAHSIHLTDSPEIQIFKNYVIENNINIDDLFYNLKQDIIKKIINLIKLLEDKKIKFILTSWTNEYMDEFQNNELIKKYLLNINYNNFNFNTFESLMNMFHDLRIVNDVDYFNGDTPKDWHMNLKCHHVVAKSIIEKLNKEFTN